VSDKEESEKGQEEGGEEGERKGKMRGRVVMVSALRAAPREVLARRVGSHGQGQRYQGAERRRVVVGAERWRAVFRRKLHPV